MIATLELVELRRGGGVLTAPVTIGATVLPLDLTLDYNEAGGLLELKGVTYAYTAVGDDFVTLASGILADAEVDTPAWTVDAEGNREETWKAWVDLGDDGDTVPASIPTSLIGYFPEGDAATGQDVEVEATADGYRVVSRPDQAALLDGAQVDVTTLSPVSDGNAPTTATTVTPIGGIGSMFYRWTEVANADPVTYRLYVRAGASPAAPAVLATNLWTNPTAGAAPTAWTGTATVTQDSTHVHSGTTAFKLTTGDAFRTLLTATATTTYTISQYVWVPSTETGTVQLRISGSGFATTLGPLVTARDQWVRTSVTVTSDVDGGSLVAKPAHGALGAVWVDDIMVEQSATLGDYFDGDTPDTAGIQYDWTGTPHASTSTKTSVSINPAYEVAAGVGLTSAAVRKLKDGTAIVADGSVTYHAIVSVEDADGPGPASTDVTGVPAQVTGPDIATGAVTTDTLVFNSGWGAELSSETINGVTITGSDITGTNTITGATVRTSASGKRVELAATDDAVEFYSGDPAEVLPASISADQGTAVAPKISVFSPYLGAGDRAYAIFRSTLGAVKSQAFIHGEDIVLSTINRLFLQSPTMPADGVEFNVSGNDLRIISGALKSISGGWSVDSSGNGSVGTGTFRDSVRSAVMGDYATGAWTAYTPTFTAATTNPTLGNFTRAGRYTQRGKTVTFSSVITATAASGFGTGTYEFGLPVAARNVDEVIVTGSQTGPTHTYIGRGETTTTFRLSLTSTEVNMNSTNSAMASGTVVRISGTYEAA